MYESNLIEQDLRKEAIRISKKKLKEAPVVIIVGGTGAIIKGKGKLGITMLASSMNPKKDRYRKIAGIIQTALQIIALKHLHPQFHTVKIVESKD